LLVTSYVAKCEDMNFDVDEIFYEKKWSVIKLNDLAHFYAVGRFICPYCLIILVSNKD
jgi:hypothetical protein